MNPLLFARTLSTRELFLVPETEHRTPVSAAASPHIRSLLDRPAFAAIREEWNDLLQQTPERFPYQTWEYLDCAWDRFGSSRVHPRILTVRHDSGALTGGLPLMIGLPRKLPLGCFRHLSFLGCHLGHEGECADLLARPGWEDRVALALARHIALDLESTWDVMAWSSVPANSRVFPKFREALKFHGILLRQHDLSTAPYIDLRLSPGLVEPASPKLRKNLRSLMRKIQGRIQTRVGGKDQTVREALEQTLRLHNLRWGYDQKGGNPHDAFHLQLAGMLEPLRQNFSLTLTVDGELAAGTYGYIRNRTFYGILMGWDPKFRHLSMGHLILDATLREVKTRDVDTFEFLGGGGEYKKRWTELEKEFLRLEGTNPHSLRAKGYDLLRKSRDLLRNRKLSQQEAQDESIAA